MESIFLKRNDTLRLYAESDGKEYSRLFTISGMISSGSCAVTYEASHKSSGIGVLKEFLPESFRVYFMRSADNTPEPIPGLESTERTKRYQNAQDAYAAAYEAMLRIKRFDTENKFSFLPQFEIFRSHPCANGFPGALYVWTPAHAVKTFDSFCEEIRKDPYNKPVQKLYLALRAIETLTTCVTELHKEGLVHRDLKPSNFGFEMRAGKPQPESLSLFDINSVRSVFTEEDTVEGTPGYMEPERGIAPFDNQTDIYSIGAILFHALIFTERTGKNGETYDPSTYDDLPRRVDGSVFLNALEIDSRERLKRTITTILQKALACRSERYADCESLGADVRKALFYLLPGAVTGKSRQREKWVLQNAEKELALPAQKNSYLFLQHMLYEYPLYEAEAQDGSVSVLVLGFGHYGQIFTDACLTLGQFSRSPVTVTIVTDDPKDFSDYTAKRPALRDYFSVNGANARTENYGNLICKIASLSEADPDGMKRVFSALCRERESSYVFISLGEDELNAFAAKTIDSFTKGAQIHYVSEKTARQIQSGNLYPTAMNTPMKDLSDYREIERMALNLHMVWENDPTQSRKDAKKRFQKPYYHDSCVTAVFSLIYKLHAMGIDLKRIGPDAAAAAFEEAIRSARENGQDIRDVLTCLEHRRWVCEKVLDGWRQMAVEECEDGRTKDVAHKKHVCLRPCRPDRLLKKHFTSEDWDTMTEKDLDALDDLDRTSVLLHRLYQNAATRVRMEKPLLGAAMNEMNRIASKTPELLSAFNAWRATVIDLWNGSSGRAGSYNSQTSAFLQKALDLLPEKDSAALCVQMKSFRRAFYPIPASMEYKDWKQNDEDQIDRIPEILTRRDDAILFSVLRTGNPTELFGELLPLLTILPKKAVYLYELQSVEEVSSLLQTLGKLAEFLKRRRNEAETEIAVFYRPEEAGAALQHLKKSLAGSDAGAFAFSFHAYEEGGLSDSLREACLYGKRKTRRRGTLLLEESDTPLYKKIKQAGALPGVARFRISVGGAYFTETDGCGFLNYLRIAPILTLQDLEALSGTGEVLRQRPEFYEDYRYLYELYRTDAASFGALCKALRTYTYENDILAVFRTDAPNLQVVSRRFLLPGACAASCEKIVDELKNAGVLSASSAVLGYTSESLSVIVECPRSHIPTLDALFSNVSALQEADSVFFEKKNGALFIRFDGMDVRSIPVREIEKGMPILLHLHERGYLLRLRQSGETVSFTYGCRQIKRLLTDEKKVGKVYLFHRLFDAGKYDDVESEVLVPVEEDETAFSFDCVLTNGGKTYFVQLKETEAETFDPVAEKAATRFGVNPVLLQLKPRGPLPSSIADLTRKSGTAEPFEVFSISQKILK